MSQDVVSFVLRFVRDAGQESGARWRGKVRHVQGSTERQFSQFSEALAFMQEQMNSTVETAAKDSAKLAQNNPWLETAKLWGEFVPRYNKLVLENVSEAVQKSASLPQELGETMSSLWQVPGNGARDSMPDNLEGKTLETKLDTLSKQLATLTNAVEKVQQDVADLTEKREERKKEG